MISTLWLTDKHEHCVDLPVLGDTHADQSDLGKGFLYWSEQGLKQLPICYELPIS